MQVHAHSRADSGQRRQRGRDGTGQDRAGGDRHQDRQQRAPAPREEAGERSNEEGQER